MPSKADSTNHPPSRWRESVSLRLVDLRSWDGSENVLVRYEVGRKDG